jgi:hypothetical protein
VAVVGAVGASWRKPSSVLLLTVLVVVPLAAVFGDWAIFHLFGNGSFLPQGSTGQHVLQWWDGWGRPLCVGGAAWVLLIAWRVRPIWSVMLAASAAAASFLWLVLALLVFLLHAGPGALN